MRILVAEADLELLRKMKEALDDAGHEVTMSRDGMSAWDHLGSSRPPDLLVACLDLGPHMLPGTALGRRAQSRQPPIPVIYLPSSIEQAEHADADYGAVLVKPFALAHLVETVDRLLSASDLEVVCETQSRLLRTGRNDGIGLPSLI